MPVQILDGGAVSASTDSSGEFTIHTVADPDSGWIPIVTPAEPLVIGSGAIVSVTADRTGPSTITCRAWLSVPSDRTVRPAPAGTQVVVNWLAFAVEQLTY